MLYKTFFLLLFFSSCREKIRFNQQKAKEEILSILQKEREAHFNKDVDLFLSHFKDTAIFVNKGTVQEFVKRKDFTNFADYFSQVEFIKWDDVAAPLIHFSNDGSLAYAIMQKQVIVKEKISGSIDTVDYAWLSAYRKTGEHWLLECNVSTNK